MIKAPLRVVQRARAASRRMAHLAAAPKPSSSWLLLAVCAWVCACRSDAPAAPPTATAKATPSTSSGTEPGSSRTSSPADAAASQPSSAEARWVRLRPPEAASFFELPASVLATPGTTGVVNPPYPGQIVKLHVRPGETVKRGQPVAEIRMPTVVAAAGEYVAARTRLDAYVARTEQLKALKAEGLVRSIEIAEAEMRLAEARADQERTGAILRSAGVAPEQARRVAQSGGSVVLKSPIDGVVIDVSAAIGETRDTAGPPLARIAGTAPARIEARAAHQVPSDATFELVTAAGERMPVRWIGQSPVADARDGTTATWFEPLPPRPLPAGLTGRLRVQPPRRPGLTIAPRSSVGENTQGAFVLTRTAGGARRAPVKVVMSSGSEALIESSLPAGAEIAEHVAAEQARP